MREMICISCPLGCELKVSQAADGTVTVQGNTCPRGEAYGRKEVTNPTRMVTSTVPVKGSKRVISVKTSTDVPKDRIMDVMRAIEGIEATPPVQIGDILLENAAGTGSDIVATKNTEGGEA